MLCQSCSKNTATTHIKTIVNGEFKEYALCSECAKKLGYMNLFDDFGFDLNNFLGSFFGSEKKMEAFPHTKRCEKCGSSFSDIVKIGKVGCAHCYDVFKDEMLMSIQRMHGNTTHSGKVPSSAGAKAKLVSNIEKTKGELKLAIEKQEFEKAAKLRDRIKAMENEVSENE